MKKYAKLIFLLIFLIAFLNLSSGEAERRVLSSKAVKVIVTKRGGRVDWSHTNNLIAHSRYGLDGYYDLWTMNPQGLKKRCLTCNNPKIPSLHNGQPAWHPNGRYIVFQSQDPKLPHNRRIDYLYTQPGHGLHNNLWLVDKEGKNFYLLRRVGLRGALLHPAFSRDGSKLLWSEKIGRGKLNWAIMVADFVESPRPHLENVRSFQPAGKVWYEAHEFSPDGSKILCTIALGRKAYTNYDIWEMDLATQKLNRLTNTPHIWDEHAHYSPDGKKIAWISSEGYPYNPAKWSSTLKTELWIMYSDGTGKRRITYFNEPGYPEYTGRQTIMSDNSWGPDGKRIVATIVFPQQGRKSSQIVIIDVDKALRRNLK